MATTDPQVLVTGAGPVGLTLAIALTRYGVPVRVFDKVPPRPPSESRAIGTHARTMEVFERLGVLAPMLAAGRPIRGFALHAEGRELGRIGFDGLDAPYPFVLILPQADTERVLLDHLAGLGVAVERPVELAGLTQDADGVTATLRHPDGREERVSAPYHVACDGGRGATRRLLGLTFEGEKTEGSLLIDCHIDWAGRQPDESFGNMYLGPRTMVITGRLPSGLWRVACTMRADDPWMTTEPTLDRMQEIVRDHWGPAVRLSDMAWGSAFQVSTRKVERLRAGRVFLAGDAAHIHSPAGGQGMNTGVQDAFNLAWKLAQHLRGPANEPLLDSYHAERYPVIETLLPRVEAMERAINVAHPLAARLRNALVSVASGFGFATAAGARTLSGLTVGYPASPVVGQHVMSAAAHLGALLRGELNPNPLDEVDFGRGPGPGGRAPDVPGVGGGRRLFELWATDPRHQLLVLPGSHAGPGRVAELRGLADRAGFGGRVRAWPVEPPGSPAGGGLADDTGELHRRYGGRHECLYLIRPDGHIAFRSQPADFEPLQEYAGRVYRWV